MTTPVLRVLGPSLILSIPLVLELMTGCHQLPGSACAATDSFAASRGAAENPHQAPIEDQTTCGLPPAGSVTVEGATWKAQTFVPGVTGRLHHVVIPGSRRGDVTVHLREALSGQPSQTDLASASLDSNGVADFASQTVELRAGRLYAIVISGSGGGMTWDYSASDSCYGNPRGRPFTSTDGGASWSPDIVDFHFSTFMVPTAPSAHLDQATCPNVSRATVDVGFNLWKGQSFVAGRSGWLARVELAGRPAPTSRVHLREMHDGRPVAADIASAPLEADGVAFFEPGDVLLKAGSSYAIVLSGGDGRA